MYSDLFRLVWGQGLNVLSAVVMSEPLIRIERIGEDRAQVWFL